jgi:hypothetical protein
VFAQPSSAKGTKSGAADSIKYKYTSTAQLDALKAEAAKEIDAKAKMIQEMVDQVFSFGELGMQEVETSKYLTGILEQNGFKVERGVAGIPTAFAARALVSQRLFSSSANICAARKRPLDRRWPARFRKRGTISALAGSKKIRASAFMPPFLTKPNDMTSTPARQLRSAGSEPVNATALAKRAPSRWKPRPRRLAIALSSATSPGE